MTVCIVVILISECELSSTSLFIFHTSSHYPLLFRSDLQSETVLTKSELDLCIPTVCRATQAYSMHPQPLSAPLLCLLEVIVGSQ